MGEDGRGWIVVMLLLLVVGCYYDPNELASASMGLNS